MDPGLDDVRRLPGMFVGSTESHGMHVLLWALVDIAVEMALAGHEADVRVTLHADNSVTIESRCNGFATIVLNRRGVRALTDAFTSLSDRRPWTPAGGIRISGGIHGVRVGIVNALSASLRVEFCDDDTVYREAFQRGVSTGPPTVATADRPHTGMSVAFMPDPEIFPEIEWSTDAIRSRMRELAFLVPTLRLQLADERAGGAPAVFNHGRGIGDYVETLHAGEEPHASIVQIEASDAGGSIEVALQWNTGFLYSIHAFANTVRLHEGSTPIASLTTALLRTINRVARECGALDPTAGDLSLLDIREGLTIVLSATLANPQFEGKTRTHLANRWTHGVVEEAVSSGLRRFFTEHPAERDIIIEKALDARRSRLLAQETRNAHGRRAKIGSPERADWQPTCGYRYLSVGDSVGKPGQGWGALKGSDGKCRNPDDEREIWWPFPIQGTLVEHHSHPSGARYREHFIAVRGEGGERIFVRRDDEAIKRH